MGRSEPSSYGCVSTVASAYMQPAGCCKLEKARHNTEQHKALAWALQAITGLRLPCQQLPQLVRDLPVLQHCYWRMRGAVMRLQAHLRHWLPLVYLPP